MTDLLNKKEDKTHKSNVRICKLCGGLFYYTGYGYGYCDNCAKIDDEIFHKVKDYIWEHGTATVIEVSENVNVSIKQIYNYLREGRLEIPESSPIFIKCERCGVDIRYGRYCPECAVQVHKNLSSITEADLCEIGAKVKKKQEGKMRFNHNHKE